MFLTSLFLLNFALAQDIQDPIYEIGIRSPHVLDGFEISTKTADDKSDLTDALTQLPNLSAAAGSNRPRFFQIRGVGETSQFEHSQVSSIGVFYEGIDLSEEASVLPLVGRENLQINYGSQSIRWGGKALGGTIEAQSCLTGPCSTELWQLSAGNYNTFSFMGGIRKKGDVSYLFNAGYLVSDGYMYNDYLRKPTQDRQEAQGVLGLAYRLGSVRVRQHHLVANHDNGYDGWSFSPSFHTLSDHPGKDRHFVNGHAIETETWLGDYRLWSLTSYTNTHQDESYDEDWANDEYWLQVPGYNDVYNYFSHFERRRQKFHQKCGLGSRSGWDLGLHFSDYDEDQVIRSFKDEKPRSEYHPAFSSKSLGFWLRKTETFGDWKVSIGSRIEHQHIQLDKDDGARDRDVAPQWAADLRLGRTSGKALASELLLQRGFRGAGYNTSTGITADRIEYQPEQIYLAQFTETWNQGDTHVLGRVYHQWQKEQQERESYQSDPMDPNTFTYFTTNISGSQSYGVEGSISQRWGAWTGRLQAGWMASEYESFIQGKRDLSGRELAQSPPWGYGARAEYNQEKWSAYLDVMGRDGYFHSADHDYKSKPYHLVDAGAARRMGSWQIKAWVKNIFDKEYVVRAYYFANEPPAWENKYYRQLGPPRTYALQLEYEY